MGYPPPKDLTLLPSFACALGLGLFTGLVFFLAALSLRPDPAQVQAGWAVQPTLLNEALFGAVAALAAAVLAWLPGVYLRWVDGLGKDREGRMRW